MARGRMLSKTISLDEKVEALSCDSARLLFTWLIAHLDVEGRMYGEARLVKSIVVPRRNYSLRTIEKYLNEMENLGLIQRYSINNSQELGTFQQQKLNNSQTNQGKVCQNIVKNQYLFAPNFEKHQPGLRKDKETQSQIPPPSPDLLRSKDGVKTELVPPKRSLSLKEKKFNNPLPPKRGNVNSIPDFIDKELWNDFLEMRKEIRKPATARAQELLIKDLEKLKAEGNDPNEVIKQSIMNSWKGLFPLKGGQDGKARRNTGPQQSSGHFRMPTKAEYEESIGTPLFPAGDGE